jgi:hypothetical protein
MPANRDTIQLVIDVLGQDGLDKLAAAADRLKTSTRAAADTYDVLERQVGEYQVVGHKAEQTTTALAAAQGVSLRAIGQLAKSTDDATVALDEMVRKAIEATAAQRALGRALDEGVAAPAAKAGKAVEGLAGAKAKGGRGLLGASYAVQDFTSVLTGGGGLARALGAVSNNVDQLATSAGLSVGAAAKLSLGFTGLVALLPLIWPTVQQWFDDFMGATGKADDGLKTFRESLDKTREAVAGINQESNSRVAALVREREALQLLIDRHNEQIAAVKKLRGLQAAGTTEREHERAANLQALVGGHQGELVAEVAAGLASPEERAGRARTKAGLASEIEGLERNLAATPGNDIAGRASLERAIAARQRRLASLAATEAGERRQAEGLVAGAVVEGKEGSLRGVLGRLPAASRFRANLEGQTNEALDRDDDEARGFDDHIERVQQATRERNERARKEKRDAAHQKAEDARHAREAKADAKARGKAGLESQAGELLAHGPEIVGQAFGPGAAAMAQNANPAEVQEIKERTMANLKDGQAPYQALLDAFREVAEASARQAQDTQRFAGQLNGVRGKISPSSESPANFVTN